MRDFNEARREMRVVAAEQAREQDLVLLEYAIEKDKAGEAEEKAKKEEEQRVGDDMGGREDSADYHCHVCVFLDLSLGGAPVISYCC